MDLGSLLGSLVDSGGKLKLSKQEQDHMVQQPTAQTGMDKKSARITVKETVKALGAQ